MTLMTDDCQRQSTENISKYLFDFLHSMTTITRLVLLLLIDHIRSLERRKQEVDKSATVDVTMSIYPSAYTKSRIAGGISIIFGNGESYNRCSTYCSFNYTRILIKTVQILVGNDAFRTLKDKHEVVPVHASSAWTGIAPLVLNVGTVQM